MRLIKIVTIARKVVPSKELISFANMDINTATANAITLRFARTISDILTSVFFTQSPPQPNYI